MKKCCQITAVHSVFDVRIFHKEAKTLAGAGYDVTLIARHDKNETVDGIKIIALPKLKNRLERFLKTDFLIFKKALEQRADVYHFHDPELILVGVLLKIFTKAKIIYDVHEDVPKDILYKEWIPVIFKHPLSSTVNFIEKNISKFFDCIIVATEYIKDQFKPYNNNVIEIKNYPLLKFNSKTSKNNFFANNECVLIYTGTIGKNRGIEEIIKAMELINSHYKISLNLMGRFSNEILKQKIACSEEYTKVNFLGELSLNKVFEEIAKADIGIVCLHPNRCFLSSLPVKMFEYMTAGLPVIASNFPLWKEIIEKNNCGICVNPLDPKEIGEAIEYLIKHPEEAKKMGENGKKAILEKYNWDLEAKKLLKIYEIIFANEK
ncbi:MAG: glycosyltransferase family 4 protein [Patescibacteria group bacterium]|nr:glycosyltransferase family 4 protein [Patescibacteria group bacterium]MDD5164181.1 glycosyltransferase family 4 protein [Patescibacteria group bacterium]MDD5534485.1 glycosyltransferase family 4 protein [Patescibacteria group bacterium]